MKNKKTKVAIISVIALILVTIGITYAYWLVTKTQTGENEITAGCLDIAISGEKNDITLSNQFPMSDEDGMKLVPYEFTVTNNCNTSVDYQVALEATGTESSAIKTSALKVALNDTVTLLSSNSEIDPTIDGAYESRLIGFSRLAASGNEGSSDTHTLRIWIDENAPISEMNKTFKSKISVTIGQGIESIYEEGTLAYSILSNYGGSERIESISIEPKETIITEGDVYISTTGNYYYGTEYTLDETTGKYALSGTLTQAMISECRNGTKTCGKYTLKQTTTTSSLTTLYEVTDFESSGNYITANTIMYTTEFGRATSASEANIYKTEDDLGDSYYYRGAVTNNYVQFGTYEAGTTIQYGYTDFDGITYEEETPIYWRIVRINGDGTIRLVYDGTEKIENGVAHTATIGTYSNNPIGYTYDTSDTDTTQLDSKVKKEVDKWYDEQIEEKYGSYIADSIFCDDSSIARYEYLDSNYNVVTDPTSAVYTTKYYSAYDRLETFNNIPKPSLKCVDQKDRYTVNDTTNGNGLLSNPVGLITGDEISFAGGVSSNITGVGNNTSYYLYSQESFFALGLKYDHHAVGDYSYSVGSNGSLSSYYSGDIIKIRPVINLKADVEFTGDGSFETPYKIITE